MANNTRVPLRSRIAGLRTKADENAASRHLRQPSTLAAAGASRFTHSAANGLKGTNPRPALSEVTTAAINRKENGTTLTNKAKGVSEIGLKRSRSQSLASATGPQRVPLGPGRGQVAPPVANTITARAPPVRVHGSKISIHSSRISRVVTEVAVPVMSPTKEEEEDSMDVEDDDDDIRETDVNNSLVGEQEVEAMIAPDDSEDEEESDLAREKPSYLWPDISPQRDARYRREVQAVRENFEDEVDMLDTTMVSEYAEEIFEYMNELEEDVMPSADYMSRQNEITWEMRQTLVDWLLQVHLRYHMLPETLWIAINIVDRFLTKRVVSLVKLQLVGVTAMFIAAKYEEILAPAVDEFVLMTENGYSKEEILKGERIVLQTLDFRISQYCSPYSWMRKISRADDYDIQTRTLGKFLTEVTLLDYRFLRAKPSLIAAVGMYCARRMLGGSWTTDFVYYSDYTEEQLIPGHDLLVQKLTEENFLSQHVCQKYAHKKFLKASIFAVQWARLQINKDPEQDMEEE